MESAPGDAVGTRLSGNNDDSLPALRADFPQFRIWRETEEGNRIRYIARSLGPGIRPHTLVTADLAELRAELSHDTNSNSPTTDRR
jgi:hypothetical protein